MDLLQEIGKAIGRKVQAESDKILGRVSNLAYDATLGLFKQYQQKMLELVRIQIGTLYAHALRITRKHLLLLTLVLFGTMVSAVALVVIPITIVLLTSWPAAIKALCLLILGCGYVGGTAWIFLVLFSEDKWMVLSGMDDMLQDIYSDDSKF